MTTLNHSNRQPIGRYLIVFLDEIENIKKVYADGKDSGLWVKKQSDFVGIDPLMREENARKATSGIVLAIGSKAFNEEEFGNDVPQVGDRVTFTSYSGMHKVEGDNFYRSLRDSEIHDYYIPQRDQLTK